MKGHKIRLGILYLLPFAATSILPFFILPIMTRHLAPEDYGVFALAQVYASFMAALANLCLPVGYERNSFACKTPQEKASLLYSVQAMVLSLLLVTLLATFILRSTLSVWMIGMAGRGDLLLITFAAAAASSLKAYLYVYMRNEEQAGAFTRWSLFEAFTSTATTLYLVVVMNFGAMGLALGQLTGHLLTYVLLVGTTMQALRWQLDLPQLRRTLHISLPLTPTLLLKNVWTNIDKFILRLLKDAHDVGLYSLGQRIGGTVFDMMTTTDGVLMPFLYKHLFSENGRDELGKGLTNFAYISCIPGLAAVLLAEVVITVLLPPNYHGAISITIIFATSYGFYFLGKVSGVQLIHCKKPFISVLLNGVSMASLVILCPILALRYGVVGVAIGSALSTSIATFSGLAIAQRYNHIPLENNKLIAIYSFFLSASVITIAEFSIRSPIWVTWTTKIGLLGAFILIGIRIGALSRENISAFWHALASLFQTTKTAPAKADR